MVTLNVIVEGQSVREDMAEKVASNAAALRQSLNGFFTRVLNTDDVQITIFMGDGYRNAARKYATDSGNQCLYVDSDFPYDSRMEWFKKLINSEHSEKSIVIPANKVDNVFFMVQEMEAWFLKQPECIERWRVDNDYDRKHPEENIAEHSLIRGKNMEDIKKPSGKLATLIKKYIFDDGKSVKYGKLSSASGLLDNLDVSTLLPMDRELQRFRNSFSGN